MKPEVTEIAVEIKPEEVLILITLVIFNLRRRIL